MQVNHLNPSYQHGRRVSDDGGGALAPAELSAEIDSDVIGGGGGGGGGGRGGGGYLDRIRRSLPVGYAAALFVVLIVALVRGGDDDALATVPAMRYSVLDMGRVVDDDGGAPPLAHSRERTGTRAHHKRERERNRTESLLEAARLGGVDVIRDGDGAILWTGEYGGQIKPVGPLRGKKVGVIVASEFSDFQAYYLASYVGEFGGELEFLLVDWVKWKFTRPNVVDKGVRGMWDLSVDPMAVMAGSNKAARYRGLQDAQAEEYDAVVVLGGHSSDVMVTEPDVIKFIKAAEENGAVLGSVGAGSMPFIAAGVMKGKRCTGNCLVDYMLKKIASFEPVPVATDGSLVTARDTVDTPAFVRALCRTFDPEFTDAWEDTMLGVKVMLLIGEDYEDIEVIVPVLEWIYRGAHVIIGRFKPQFTSRPPHPYSNYAVGNFGTTIPFQEIPDDNYTIMNLEDVAMDDFDVVVITGAFNPWNIVATGKTDWLREAHSQGKLIAAICHGPIAVAAADLAKGKKMTGWLASKDSVEIMGGVFSYEKWAAVIDGQLISGRTPPELPEFINAVNVALLD